MAETAGASRDHLERVGRGLQPPHYIHKVSVIGLDARGAINAQLDLSIDWRQHSLMVKAGGANVALPATWTNSVGPSLVESINTFNEAVQKARLTVEWTVTYGPGYDRDAVNRYLGFRHATPRVWRREPERLRLGFGILSEAELVVSLAID
ncbi:hypothetical protein ACFTSF_07035 [Kribbella sp. NPDC056951]|uniref:hypothetical protein n=1 Tax=Kribbella sp. NPDC056951 TaxID=3345978 RepID=UPI003637A30C